MYKAIIITVFISILTDLSRGISVNRPIVNLSESNVGDYLRVKRHTSHSNCGINDFACDSGHCVRIDNLCDSIKDCQDGSDETLSSCNNNECDDYLFRCSYGACIEKSMRCNGKTECADGSDEAELTCGILNDQPTCKSICEKNVKKQRIETVQTHSVRDFTCGTGECIPNTSVCDGQPDCSDVLDESTQACEKNACDPYQFRCNYGACIEESQVCDGISDCYDSSDEASFTCRFRSKPTTTPTPDEIVGCTLPTIANGGVYKIGPPNTGRVVPVSTGVIYQCQQSFILQPALQYATCLANFTWSHVSVCNVACPEISSLSLHIEYSVDHKNGEVLGPGTTAKLTCKQYYDPPDRHIGSNTAICLSSGQWNIPIFNCVPRCGQETTYFKPLILKGDNISVQHVPWNVGIYRARKPIQKSAIPDHICGGTIISERLILSAAHCFWNNTLRGIDKEYVYYVGGGKVMRNYNIQEEFGQVQRVNDIKVHEDYRGVHKAYINDIAILILKFDRAFHFNNGLQPACIDWFETYEADALRKGSYGNISGWGLTSSGGQPSEVLKQISLPYLTMEECEKIVPPNFVTQLLHDKICVGGIDGAGVCEGDSGSGLMFKSLNNLWYIRGIVSISPFYKDSCHPHSPAAFTKLEFFKQWVDKYFTMYNNAFKGRH